MKKTFLIFFLIIIKVYFAYDLDMTIKDNNNNNLKDIIVYIDGNKKITNLDGKVTFDQLKGLHQIDIKSDYYTTRKFFTEMNNDKEIIVYLDNKDVNFTFALGRGDDLIYTFEENEIEYPIGNAVVNIIKDNQLFYTFDYMGKPLEFFLKEGKYTIEIFTVFREPYIIKDLYLNPEKNKQINISLPISLSQIEGRLISNNSYLGGVTITFIDQGENSYSFKSNIQGFFKGTLPPNIYRVKVNKKGYFVNEDLTLDFSNSDQKYKPIIEVAEIPSIIKGYVFDTKGKPLKNSKLEIKNNGNDLTAYTSMDGSYNLEVEKGLVFIKSNAKGYYPSGKIERVEAFSTKSISDIIVQERYSTISGTVTNGILPLSSVRINLYNEKGEFIASTLTSSNGFYRFDDVKIVDRYYVKVDNNKYLPYESSIFSVEEKVVRNFNILLNDNNVNFVIELTSVNGTDREGVEVLVNGLKYRSDLNGIINERILAKVPLETIKVKIPKFNFYKEYLLKDLGKEPYLIKIQI